MKLRHFINQLDKRGFDSTSVLEKAIDAVEYTDVQKQAIELMRGGRDPETLRKVMKLIKRVPFEAYDPDSLVKRARWRAEKLRKRVPELSRHQGLRLLDLGSGRGEFLRCLADDVSAEMVALDIKTSLFDERRVEDPSYERLMFLEAPAEKVPVASGSFDLVTGYNSMEHFDDPKQVVDECVRILRPGGQMYFYFGPPWNGPYGPHLTNVLGLPYVHHLFDRDVVREVLGRKGNPYVGKNEWSLQAFSELFRGSDRYDCTFLRYEYTLDHAWLLKAFPDDFSHLDADELTVRAVEVVCRTRGNWRVIDRASAATLSSDKSEPAVAPSVIARSLRSMRSLVARGRR